MSEPEKKKKTHKTDPRLHEAAKKLGHEGGLKGGPKRAKSLTAEERSAIARSGGLAHAARSGVKGSKQAEKMRHKKDKTKGDK